MSNRCTALNAKRVGRHRGTLAHVSSPRLAVRTLILKPIWVALAHQDAASAEQFASRSTDRCAPCSSATAASADDGPATLLPPPRRSARTSSWRARRPRGSRVLKVLAALVAASAVPAVRASSGRRRGLKASVSPRAHSTGRQASKWSPTSTRVTWLTTTRSPTTAYRASRLSPEARGRLLTTSREGRGPPPSWSLLPRRSWPHRSGDSPERWRSWVGLRPIDTWTWDLVRVRRCVLSPSDVHPRLAPRRSPASRAPSASQPGSAGSEPSRDGLT
jgi:hypothetical protein